MEADFSTLLSYIDEELNKQELVADIIDTATAGDITLIELWITHNIRDYGICMSIGLYLRNDDTLLMWRLEITDAETFDVLKYSVNVTKQSFVIMIHNLQEDFEVWNLMQGGQS